MADSFAKSFMPKNGGESKTRYPDPHAESLVCFLSHQPTGRVFR
jgi:hypothetical protein